MTHDWLDSHELYAVNLLPDLSLTEGDGGCQSLLVSLGSSQSLRLSTSSLDGGKRWTRTLLQLIFFLHKFTLRPSVNCGGWVVRFPPGGGQKAWYKVSERLASAPLVPLLIGKWDDRMWCCFAATVKQADQGYAAKNKQTWILQRH